MPGITFTEEDLKSTGKLEASWYVAEVKSVTANPPSKPGSKANIVWEVNFVISDGPAAGTPVRHWFNDAFMRDAVFFIGCFVAKVEAGKEYPIESVVGKKVKIYVKFDMERKNNVIIDFQKVA